MSEPRPITVKELRALLFDVEDQTLPVAMENPQRHNVNYDVAGIEVVEHDHHLGVRKHVLIKKV
jgi:hypothetical protein